MAVCLFFVLHNLHTQIYTHVHTLPCLLFIFIFVPMYTWCVACYRCCHYCRYCYCYCCYAYVYVPTWPYSPLRLPVSLPVCSFFLLLHRNVQLSITYLCFLLFAFLCLFILILLCTPWYVPQRSMVSQWYLFLFIYLFFISRKSSSEK